MTKNKRFILKENGVIDDTQLNILLDGGEDKEDMVDLLNDLSDENEEFKKALVELKEIGDYQEGRIKELNDENDQLQEELEQCKAVIDNRWSEYLKKKEGQEND